ncbi:uncharacterized protein LOC115035146 [Acyrthosiphon pisum]|uniref:Uncharacterized protein n=1 Tax=Acyrthosiphon pisum TaxID=7029 RepID=A0A8R2NX87_ACYPI|nr:uncharacterized protein LOC115035146 [Acyrthosiphon pisum]
MLERLQKKSEIIRKRNKRQENRIKILKNNLSESVKKLESMVTSDITEKLKANNVPDYQQVIIKEILAATKIFIKISIVKESLSKSTTMYNDKKTKKHPHETQKNVKKTATAERIEREQFRANMILNYAEHLLPVVPKDKFKNPLLRYYNFIKFGVQINSNSYNPIEQNTVDRIVCSLPPKYQSSPLLLTLIKDLINEYEITSKKSIIHIGFGDLYDDHEDLSLVATPIKKELRETAHLWKKSIEHSRLNLEQNILQLNPIIIQMIKLWNENYK